MLKSLNFKHIFYFWVVGKEASIVKASTLLNVSQSSISEQIKILEGNIGTQLFDRTQKKMNLTSNGKTLFKTLDEFFPRIGELFESLTHHKTTDVKFLRIGLCPTISLSLRVKLCFPFIKDDHYTVKILQGENQFLANAFDRDDVDLIFTTNDHMTPHGKYEKFIIGEKEFCIVMNHKLFQKNYQNEQVSSLGKLNWINYTPDSDLHFKILDFFHKQKISPVRMAEIDDIQLIKQTIKNLDCFSILPVNAIKDDLKNKILSKMDFPAGHNIEAKITAIYRPQFSNERFIGHLTQLAHEYYK